MTNFILCISFLGHCMIENQQRTERFCLFAHLFNSRKPLWIIILIPKKFCAWHIYSCCHNWRKNIEIRIVFLVRPSEGWGQVFLHFLKMTLISWANTDYFSKKRFKNLQIHEQPNINIKHRIFPMTIWAIIFRVHKHSTVWSMKVHSQIIKY